MRHACEVGDALAAQGHKLAGVHLDSGDLAYLAVEAREILDARRFPDAAIVASNDLDERLIESLKHQGATITVWGVGAELVTAYDLSAGAEPSRTMIDPLDPTRQCTFGEDLDAVDLLVPVFRAGIDVYAQPSVHESRDRARAQIASLHSSIRRFDKHGYPVGLKASLHALRNGLLLAARGPGRSSAPDLVNRSQPAPTQVVWGQRGQRR